MVLQYRPAIFILKRYQVKIFILFTFRTLPNLGFSEIRCTSSSRLSASPALSRKSRSHMRGCVMSDE
jgi:hypothetical protein